MSIPLITKGKICFAGSRASPMMDDNRIVDLKINIREGLLFIVNKKIITNVVKGDTLIFEIDINADITNWKIRAEIFDDCNHCIRLATANVTGGSSDQIEVTNIEPECSTFLIKVPSGATDCFEDDSMLEVEVETPNTVGGEPEIKTICKANIDFKRQQITWESVT